MGGNTLQWNNEPKWQMHIITVGIVRKEKRSDFAIDQIVLKSEYYLFTRRISVDATGRVFVKSLAAAINSW